MCDPSVILNEERREALKFSNDIAFRPALGERSRAAIAAKVLSDSTIVMADQNIILGQGLKPEAVRSVPASTNLAFGGDSEEDDDNRADEDALRCLQDLDEDDKVQTQMCNDLARLIDNAKDEFYMENGGEKHMPTFSVTAVDSNQPPTTTIPIQHPQGVIPAMFSASSKGVPCVSPLIGSGVGEYIPTTVTDGNPVSYMQNFTSEPHANLSGFPSGRPRTGSGFDIISGNVNWSAAAGVSGSLMPFSEDSPFVTSRNQVYSQSNTNMGLPPPPSYESAASSLPNSLHATRLPSADVSPVLGPMSHYPSLVTIAPSQQQTQDTLLVRNHNGVFLLRPATKPAPPYSPPISAPASSVLGSCTPLISERGGPITPLPQYMLPPAVGAAAALPGAPNELSVPATIHTRTDSNPVIGGSSQNGHPVIFPNSISPVFGGAGGRSPGLSSRTSSVTGGVYTQSITNSMSGYAPPPTYSEALGVETEINSFPTTVKGEY